MTEGKCHFQFKECLVDVSRCIGPKRERDEIEDTGREEGVSGVGTLSV